MRVCHMSSCHQPKDTRIFLKECVSLAEAGHDVFFVVQGESEEDRGVSIVGCGEKPAGRKDRMTGFSRKVFEQALALDCDVYHFHDPELLQYGPKLKKAGKKVVFDSHEDVPSQIMDKHWIPALVRKAVAATYRAYETSVVKRIDAVVAATPHIERQFQGRAKRVVSVNNYPRLDDIVYQTRPFEERDSIVCYAGGINELRGERIMVQAMKGVHGTLVLAGEHDDSAKTTAEVPDNVVYLGFQDRAGINQMYGSAICGLVVLQPTRAYVDALPIKMFEYMAAGLPVIASGFPLWRGIVDECGCGLCVDPTDASAVRKACEFFIENPSVGMEMGQRGRKAVEAQYSWENEARKLIELYKLL